RRPICPRAGSSARLDPEHVAVPADPDRAFADRETLQVTRAVAHRRGRQLEPRDDLVRLRVDSIERDRREGPNRAEANRYLLRPSSHGDRRYELVRLRIDPGYGGDPAPGRYPDGIGCRREIATCWRVRDPGHNRVRPRIDADDGIEVRDAGPDGVVGCRHSLRPAAVLRRAGADARRYGVRRR